MSENFKFDRMELAGSLGDLGTLLPISIAMVVINGLSPLGLFFGVGAYYILSGIYFRLTVPVQPMKVIGAYAIATSISATQISASSFLVGLLLFLVGVTGAINVIRKITPQAVVRGVQLSTGALLISSGIKFMIGTSKFQELHHAVEPYLVYQFIGCVPIGLVIGVAAALLTLLLLDNKRFPAGLIVVSAGFAIGLVLGTNVGLGNKSIAINLPELLPFGFPGEADFTFALLTLVLPQLPMTVGNAVFAYTDLSREYFGDRSSRVTNRNVCLSMALANFFSFFLGGMPLCHGAGGLAAHFRFGARTAGSNVIIGVIFLALAILLGNDIVKALNLLPLSVLGVLLVFAGSQLTLAIMDLDDRKDCFVATLILGVALAYNLAAGFVAGMIVAQVLRWKKLSV